jgi:hypothetical protein
MKTAILALCLLGAAFAAPIENYVDPDCIEEDQTFEEPISDIEAEFALGVPDLTIGLGNNNNNDEECEDDVFTPEPAFEEPVSEECVDELEYEPTEPMPEMEPTEAENCEDPIEYTEAPVFAETEAEAEDCVDTDAPTEEIPAFAPTDAGDECEGEDEAAIGEGLPELNIRIEPAHASFDEQMVGDYGDEQEFEPIEECEE